MEYIGQARNRRLVQRFLNLPCQFVLPAQLSAEKFVTQLSLHVDSCLVAREQASKTFYDSFDWRLYSQNLLCEYTTSKANKLCLLTDFAKNKRLAAVNVDTMPVFWEQFPQQKTRTLLAPILEMRALLPLLTVNCQIFQLNVVNKDEKTVLRIVIEEYADSVNGRVFLQPIKGYDKVFASIGELLSSQLLLQATDASVFLEILAQQGRQANDYPVKSAVTILPEMPADIAIKSIYSHLLATIKCNEQGVVAATDSEFLHDFRVAVRKTRSGLSQLKGVLPAETNTRFSEFFAWLGQVTSVTRDFDVYLLNFAPYKNSLPITIRDDLNPLYDFLVSKQQAAQSVLANHLQSANYLDGLQAWEQFLQEDASDYLDTLDDRITVKSLADKCIWKVYKRVLSQGTAINGQSPPEALHDLRKTCKKLRYLMEFFASIYPKAELKQLLGYLKSVQEVLGDFQDYQVQEDHLQQFGEEMLQAAIAINTFLAMGVLIQYLGNEKAKARDDFHAVFLAFAQPENRDVFKRLFASKP